MTPPLWQKAKKNYRASWWKWKKERKWSHSVMSDSLWPHELQHARPPYHHQLPEFTQTHVYQVGDAIQPTHPLLSPSPPAFNLSQYQGLFKWVSSSHQVAKVVEFQLQHQAFQWIFRTDFLSIDCLNLLAVHRTLKNLCQHHIQSVNSLLLSLRYGPTLTSVPDAWKNQALTIQTCVIKVMSLLFNTLSRFVRAFPPSWNQDCQEKYEQP